MRYLPRLLRKGPGLRPVSARGSGVRLRASDSSSSALGVGRAVIRAWHFKAGAVNVFSGLRAPAAPSLTVNTAFVDPDRCHLFPPAWVPSLAPCCVLVGPVFPWPGVGPGGSRPCRGLARHRGFRRCPGAGCWCPAPCGTGLAIPLGRRCPARVIPAPTGLGSVSCHPRACGACRGNLHRGRVRWRSSPRLRGNRCH